jgi:thiol-disulfide isomerase/thioredoxin
MRPILCGLAAFFYSWTAAWPAGLVTDVRAAIAHNDFAAAERLTRESLAKGTTPEGVLALSWLSRSALAAKQLDKADAYASETRDLSLKLLRARKMDEEPSLPTAFGAYMEVHAQVLAARGEVADAVEFLQQQLETYTNTSLHERIQKNINLLNLEGKPAPPLEEALWLGAKPPALDSLRGHPVLLFFWAHWCPDCKAEAPVIAGLQKTFGPKGLVVISPTKLYGYVNRGDEAQPEVEKPYIEKVRVQYYSILGDMFVPVSSRNFQIYGVSTTPTLVLIGRNGIVRTYHPGNMTNEELSSRIQALLSK